MMVFPLGWIGRFQAGCLSLDGWRRGSGVANNGRSSLDSSRRRREFKEATANEIFALCGIASIRITGRGEKFGQCQRVVAGFEMVTTKGELLMKPTHGTDGYLP